MFLVFGMTTILVIMIFEKSIPQTILLLEISDLQHHIIKGPLA